MLGLVTGTLLLAGLGCGGMEPDPGTVSADNGTQTEESALIRRRRPPPPPPSTGSGGSSGGTSIEAIIRAAQTPDGQAIPQPAGPNGACAPVVAALGFWSCPIIGQTCSFSNSAGTHHCTCSRTDGEGQNPTWICN
jgi:hypothetical protein